MQRIISDITKDELIEAMKRSLGDVLEFVLDPDITDIEYNTTSDNVFLDGTSGRQMADFRYDNLQAESFVHTVASYHGIEINEDNPTLSVALPPELKKCRLQANMSPITRGVSFVLRKPGASYPMEDYVSKPVKKLIQDILLKRDNILLAGSTGAGKTSFLNSILAELNRLMPTDRLNILEDTHEVQCSHRNHEFLFTITDRKGKEVISMADNVKNALRNNPNRIIAGEVRDQKSARAILNAWETGHEGGLCTFHASGARQGFDRYFHLADFHWENAGHHRFMASAIDYIFYLEKKDGVREVREVVSVGFDRETGREVFTQEYPAL